MSADAPMSANTPIFRKSRRSNSNGSACVEAADNLPARVLVRDSKDPAGGTLTFAPAAWRSFISHTSGTR